MKNRIIFGDNSKRMRVPMFLIAQHNHPASFEQFIDKHHLVSHDSLKRIVHNW